MSTPSCTAIWPVNDETRFPNPEVIHPFTGQIEGVEAQRVHEVLRVAEPDPEKRPAIHVGF